MAEDKIIFLFFFLNIFSHITVVHFHIISLGNHY